MSKIDNRIIMKILDDCLPEFRSEKIQRYCLRVNASTLKRLKEESGYWPQDSAWLNSKDNLHYLSKNEEFSDILALRLKTLDDCLPSAEDEVCCLDDCFSNLLDHILDNCNQNLNTAKARILCILEDNQIDESELSKIGSAQDWLEITYFLISRARGKSMVRITEKPSYTLKDYLPLLHPVFEGRTDELTALHAHFLSGHKYIFLYGMGGIGKTELAKQYAFTYKDKYDKIIYLTYRNSIMDTVIDDKGLTIPGMTPSNPRESFFMKKLQVVNTILTEHSLVILDNFNTDYDENLDIFLNGVFHTIVTTRYRHGGYFTQEITPIFNQHTLLDIFTKNLPYALSLTNENQNILFEIFELLEYHTLAIELVAKQAAVNHVPLYDLLATLKEKYIKGISVQKIKNGIQHLSAFDIICLVFDISTLSRDEIFYMYALSLIWPDAIQVSYFAKLVNTDSYEIINGLIDKSWIQRIQEFAIGIHSIIREVVIHKVTFQDTYEAPFYNQLRKLYPAECNVQTIYNDIPTFAMGSNIIKNITLPSNPPFHLVFFLHLYSSGANHFIALEEMILKWDSLVDVISEYYGVKSPQVFLTHIAKSFYLLDHYAHIDDCSEHLYINEMAQLNYYISEFEHTEYNNSYEMMRIYMKFAHFYEELCAVLGNLQYYPDYCGSFSNAAACILPDNTDIIFDLYKKALNINPIVAHNSQNKLSDNKSINKSGIKTVFPNAQITDHHVFLHKAAIIEQIACLSYFNQKYKQALDYYYTLEDYHFMIQTDRIQLRKLYYYISYSHEKYAEQLMQKIPKNGITPDSNLFKKIESHFDDATDYFELAELISVQRILKKQYAFYKKYGISQHLDMMKVRLQRYRDAFAKDINLDTFFHEDIHQTTALHVAARKKLTANTDSHISVLDL